MSDCYIALGLRLLLWAREEHIFPNDQTLDFLKNVVLRSSTFCKSSICTMSGLLSFLTCPRSRCWIWCSEDVVTSYVSSSPTSRCVPWPSQRHRDDLILGFRSLQSFSSRDYKQDHSVNRDRSLGSTVGIHTNAASASTAALRRPRAASGGPEKGHRS